MLYLLTQILRNRPNSGVPSGPRTAWTDYVRCLPTFVGLPTMWNEAERALLNGTSLEVIAKCDASVDARTTPSFCARIAPMSRGPLFWCTGACSTRPMHGMGVALS